MSIDDDYFDLETAIRYECDDDTWKVWCRFRDWAFKQERLVERLEREVGSQEDVRNYLERLLRDTPAPPSRQALSAAFNAGVCNADYKGLPFHDWYAANYENQP